MEHVSSKIELFKRNHKSEVSSNVGSNQSDCKSSSKYYDSCHVVSATSHFANDNQEYSHNDQVQMA